MGDSYRTNGTNRPMHPSRPVKLQEEFRVRIGDLQPLGFAPADIGYGFDVDRWASVVVTVHPSVPSFAAGAVVGWKIKLIPWVYREAAMHGSRQPSGQWFALDTWDVPLDGTGPMERVFLVGTAKKLYLQPESWEGAPGGFPTVAIGAYGLGLLGDPAGALIGVAGSGGGGGGGSLVTLFDGPVDAPLPAHAAFGGARARSVQAPPVGADDRLVGLVANRRGELVLAGYDWLALALRGYRINPEWEHHDETFDISANPLVAPVGAPIVAYTDLRSYQHHTLQVQLLGAPGVPADVCAIDFAFSNYVTATPGALPASAWTPVNDLLVSSPGNVPLDNAFGNVNKVYAVNGFSGQWLRVSAWRVSGAVGNVAAEVRRTSWY